VSTFKRFPLWFEITLLIGLAIIFAVTFWQYQDAKKDFQHHEEEIKAPLPQK
jgi:hypothetical protein